MNGNKTDLIQLLNEVTENLYGEKPNRPFIDFVLKKIEEEYIKEKRKNVFIIEAPTGYGKTSISAVIALFGLISDNQFKTIISYPLRTLLEDQYKTLYNGKFPTSGLPNIYFSKKGKIQLLRNYHLIGKRYMHNPYSRYLIKPITLTTVDTLSLTLFGIPPEDIGKVAKKYEYSGFGSMGHYLFAWSSVAFSNLVLDEVHLISDQTKSLSFLIFLIKFAIEMNLLLILMSATIPNVLLKLISSQLEIHEKEKILAIFYSSNDNSIKKEEINLDNIIIYEKWKDDKFVNEREHKNYTIELLPICLKNCENKEKQNEILISKLTKLFKQNLTENLKRVIIIFNTVNDAIHFYENIKNDTKIIEYFGKDNVILLHSRFTEKDRKILIEEKLKRLKDKYIIISTQVIEAGIDISSDFMITELCPANSLIQRLGRFLRYPGENFGKIIIWYRADENNEPLITKIEFIKTNKQNLKNYFKTKKEIKLKLNYLKELAEKDNALNSTINEIKPKLINLVCENLEINKKYKDKINLIYKENIEDFWVVQFFYTVYDYILVYKTWKYLNENENINKLNVHLPDTYNSNKIGYRKLLNYVYTEGIFQYDVNTINEFKGIFMNLENASILALEKFFELEGSFVRDSLLLPVYVVKNISKLKNELKNENSDIWKQCSIKKNNKKRFCLSKFVQNYFVPLDFETFKGLIYKKEDKESLVKYIYVVRIKTKLCKKKNKVKKIFQIKKEKNIENIFKNENNLIKYLVTKDVIGFILISDKIEYDKEIGLHIK